MSSADSVRPSRFAGFTLMELLLVILLMGIMLTFAVPRFEELTQANMKSSARMLAGAVRYLHNEAASTQALFRLNYGFEERSYWVTVCLPDEKNQCEWVQDSTTLSRPRQLPRGIYFGDIQTAHDERPVAEGKAFTHFLPRGFVEQTVIHLRDQTGEHQYTLLILPIGGRVKIFPERKELELWKSSTGEGMGGA